MNLNRLKCKEQFMVVTFK